MQSMPSTLPSTLPPIKMFQWKIAHLETSHTSSRDPFSTSFQKLGRRSSSRRHERRRSDRRRDSRHLAHEVGVGLRLPQPSNNSKIYRHCMHINTYLSSFRWVVFFNDMIQEVSFSTGKEWLFFRADESNQVVKWSQIRGIRVKVQRSGSTINKHQPLSMDKIPTLKIAR